MPKKVAIQGIKGSFHDMVARKFFKEPVEIVSCLYFDEVADKLSLGEVDYGIMAIENTLAGSLLPNYMLIDLNDLFIIGEVYLPVKHCLMALPGQRLEDIQEVRSHPMALLQTKNFFKHYPHIRRVEYMDTAIAARDIALEELEGVAAIAPHLSAELYGLDILAKDIQDHETNTTRFVVLAPDMSQFEKGSNKISMKMILTHQTGSLAKVLSILAKYNWNLTKIQSVPIYGKPWEYAFFIDALYPPGKNHHKIIKELLQVVGRFKILGLYKNQLS